MSDDNSDGFTSDSTGVYSDPGSMPSSGTDFEGWDWKQIEASIVGGAAMDPGSDGADRAKSLANPQSLFDAANILHTAQLNLAALAQIIKDQTEALAGQYGPWQGDAAKQFVTMMTKFYADLSARSDQIAGGKSGQNNVPNQLYNNGVYLQWAQNAIVQIDQYYAAQVDAAGGRMKNGLAQVSKFPAVVTMMTNDMKKVADQLGANYKLTISDMVIPDTTGFDDPNKNDDAPPPPDPDDNPPPPPDTTDLPPPPDPNDDLPPPPKIDTSIPPPPTADGNIPPPPTGDGGDIPPFSGLNGPGSDGDIPPLSSDLSGPGSDGGIPPLSSDLSGPGSDGGIPPSSVDTGLPPDGGIPSDTGIPGLPDGGPGGDQAFSPSDVPPFGSGGVPAFSPANIPGAPGGGKTPAEDDAINPADVPAPPGEDGLGEDGLGDGSTLPSDLNDPALEGSHPNLATPAPFAPPLGSSSPNGAGNPPGGAERPDAAGLLSSDGEPWEGLPTDGELAAPDVTGGAHPADWAGEEPHLASPSPFAPPLGSSSPNGAGNPPGAERPDAAGLLASDGEPWEGLPADGELAAPDVTGGAHPADWAGDEPNLATPAPFAPPLGSSSPHGAGNPPAAERPDAAGLLASDGEPWEGLPTEGEVTAPDVTGGAVPAGWAGDELNVPALPVALPDPGERELLTPPPFAPAFGSQPTGGVPGGGVERPDARGLLASAGEPWTELSVEGEVAVPTTTAGSPPAAEDPGLLLAPFPLPVANPIQPIQPIQPVEPLRSDPARLLSANSAARLDPETPPRVESEKDGGRSVPVVRPSHGNEDTSAWDQGVSLLFPLYVADRAAKPEATESEESYEAVPTYQRRRTGGPALVPDRPLIMCSAEEAPPPPEIVDDEDEEEESERGPGDLLNQDSSAWRTDGAATAGVLE